MPCDERDDAVPVVGTERATADAGGGGLRRLHGRAVRAAVRSASYTRSRRQAGGTNAAALAHGAAGHPNTPDRCPTHADRRAADGDRAPALAHGTTGHRDHAAGTESPFTYADGPLLSRLLQTPGRCARHPASTGWLRSRRGSDDRSTSPRRPAIPLIGSLSWSRTGPSSPCVTVGARSRRSWKFGTVLTAGANEQGLLSVAFDPDFATNGTFYVYYTDFRGDTVVARYRIAPNNPAVADPGSEEIILRVDQPYSNHNGGLVLFGPDGYLYIGLGDGGSGGDPQGHGQDPRTLLGTILRIDVRRSATYVVPPDNPFVGQSDRRPEIWAYGLRNPWRFSFDRLTGDLYIADVGQNALEEISFQPANSKGGENYGWKVYEGSELFQGPPRAGLTPPISEYGRQEGLLSNRRLRVPGPAVARAHRQLPLWRLLHRVRLGTDAAGRRLLGAYSAVRLQRPDHLLRRG